MKFRKTLTMIGAAAALCLGTSQVLAQGGGFGGGGPGGGFGGGGPGGGFGGGGGRGRNFDPQAMQDQAYQNLRDMMSVTNDDEWRVIQDRVQKVVDASDAVGQQGFNLFRLARGGGGGRNGGNGGGRRGGFAGGGGFGGGQTMPELDALNTSIENNASEEQIAAAMNKYRAARKVKEDALAKAQADLKAVLTPKQEGVAVSLYLIK
jgi:Spy/CpxP family protein refolding chaperone